MMYVDRGVAHEPETDFVPPDAKAKDRPKDAEKFSIETRFGNIEVLTSSIIQFRSGLLGFGAATEFVLVDLEDPKYQHFRILQCVNSPELSFIVFPPTMDSGLIDRLDIDAAAKAVNFPTEELLVLLLVTVRRQNDASALSVNLRAPVIIDPERFLGVQYVLPNEKYPVRFNL